MISDFIKDLILDKESHKQLIIVFHGNVYFNFAHAACFVRAPDYRKSKQMLLLDCKNKTPIVCPRLGADQIQFSESLKINEDIVGSYHKWEIYALERRVVANEIERARIHNRMMYVLTGDKKYQVESLVAGAMTTNQKRKQRKYKKRGRFYHRPDHTLSEKKRKRAEAQKAEASREPEPEQPIMAEEPVMEDVEEPMEVDEIRLGGDDTAMVQDDDQPLDYNIAEYLDDPSKLFIYFTKNYRPPPSRLHRASHARV